ncbi:hypothetical protein [Pseudomonas mandelii]|uniref:Uncharacterized protein n=1 Tax=Pseudomonas mandelii TaxID=75612 RepID=A0A502ID21_9PSED|nr:hypothetical protein [Pseudomonas mandelii]TPG84801.1 hypothetical protein EAH74_12325 [Pseudomonas mandelii]
MNVKRQKLQQKTKAPSCAPNMPRIKLWSLLYVLVSFAFLHLFVMLAKYTFNVLHLFDVSRVFLTMLGIVTITSITAIFVNFLFLKYQKSGSGKVWVTHRMSEEVANKKLALGVLTPYTSARDLEKQWFINILDGKIPCTWVSVGRPNDVSDILVGNRDKANWAIAICFQIPAERLRTPPILFKHYFGLYQQRLLGEVDLACGYELYDRTGKHWELLGHKEAETQSPTRKVQEKAE